MVREFLALGSLARRGNLHKHCRICELFAENKPTQHKNRWPETDGALGRRSN